MKHEWPIATVRKEDGLIAVWLTHQNWMIIRDGIIRKYLDNRRHIGARQARLQLKKPNLLDSWPLEQGLCDAALELYTAGWRAYGRLEADDARKPVTPERLVEMGDKEQAQAQGEERRKLAHDSGRWVTGEELVQRLIKGGGHRLARSLTVNGYDIWPEEKDEVWHITFDEYDRYDRAASAEYEKRRAAKEASNATA